MKKTTLIFLLLCSLAVGMISLIVISSRQPNLQIFSNIEVLANDEMGAGIIYCSFSYVRDNKCSCYCCGKLYNADCGECGQEIQYFRDCCKRQCYKNE